MIQDNIHKYIYNRIYFPAPGFKPGFKLSKNQAVCIWNSVPLTTYDMDSKIFNDNDFSPLCWSWKQIFMSTRLDSIDILNLGLVQIIHLPNALVCI